MTDNLPDIRSIVITLDVDDEGLCDPQLTYDGLGDFEAFGVLSIVTQRLARVLMEPEDDDLDDD